MFKKKEPYAMPFIPRIRDPCKGTGLSPGGDADDWS